MRTAPRGERWGRGGWSSAVIFVLVFGVFLPWQTGKSWVESDLSLVYWAWVPVLLVSGVVAQSFAGERERHTLESLLATRLPDSAILAGKLVAVVLYAWGLTLASLVLGVITTNVLNWADGPVLYSLGSLASILSITLLVSLLGASAGVLVSLRASTVRQAQQTLGVASMVLVLGTVYGVQALPVDWNAVASGGGDALRTVILIVAGALVVLDGVLIALAAQRFQRSKLILD